MTVLAKYQRLEAEAIWRPDPEAQRRDVIVSIGDATLTLSAFNGSALSHWSLPAIRRLNPDATPALYAPGLNAPETLEIEDQEMIDAIEQVLKAIRRGAPGSNRMRKLGYSAAFLVMLAIGIFWLPVAIAHYVASIAPPATKTFVGTKTFEQVQHLTGVACNSQDGKAALLKLQNRLFPSKTTTLAILPSALSETASLPGGWILASHTLVEDHESPEVLAGHLLAEDVRRTKIDPLKSFMETAGLRPAIGFLTSGTFRGETLARTAERVVAAVPVAVSDKALIARMVQAKVPSAPYGFAKDIIGEQTSALIEAPETKGFTQPLMTDGDWIALQRICEN